MHATAPTNHLTLCTPQNHATKLYVPARARQSPLIISGFRQRLFMQWPPITPITIRSVDLKSKTNLLSSHTDALERLISNTIQLTQCWCRARSPSALGCDLAKKREYLANATPCHSWVLCTACLAAPWSKHSKSGT